MSRNLVFFLTVAATLCQASAWAHGIPVDIGISGGQLVSASTLVYSHHDSELILTGTGVKGAIGVYPQFGVFPTGEALTIDAAGSPLHPASLMYWDGASVGPSPVAALLTRTGISIPIGPTDTFVAGGTLPPYNGTLGGHSALTITLPTDAPTGLYAFGLRASNPTYGQAETVWAVGNYGLVDEAIVEAGLAAMHAQVPEPSALALAIGGGLALACMAWRRRKAS